MEQVESESEKSEKFPDTSVDVIVGSDDVDGKTDPQIPPLSSSDVSERKDMTADAKDKSADNEVEKSCEQQKNTKSEHDGEVGDTKIDPLSKSDAEKKTLNKSDAEPSPHSSERSGGATSLKNQLG